MRLAPHFFVFLPSTALGLNSLQPRGFNGRSSRMKTTRAILNPPSGTFCASCGAFAGASESIGLSGDSNEPLRYADRAGANNLLEHTTFTLIDGDFCVFR